MKPPLILSLLVGRVLELELNTRVQVSAPCIYVTLDNHLFLLLFYERRIIIPVHLLHCVVMRKSVAVVHKEHCNW